MQKLATVSPEVFQFELPPKPDWFDKALAEAVPRFKGQIMFRCVNGLKEKAWMDGDKDFLKYRNSLLECIPVNESHWTRYNSKTQKHQRYATETLALADTDKNLGQPRPIVQIGTRWLGAPCWIIEVFVEAKCFGTFLEWENHRYEMDYDRKGVYRKIDLLGEYPSNGVYKYCFSILNDDGTPVAPNRSHIEKVKELYQAVMKDNRSVSQRMRDDAAKVRKLDESVKKRILEGFGEFSPLTLKRIEGAEIGKPIKKVKQ